MQPSALFVGLCTLDIVQAVARMPGPNEKVTALRQSAAAGGPATNASVAFACLGGRATLLTGAGRHPLADGVRADLDRAGVTLIDVAADDEAPPAVSSILVTEGSGDRSVVSVNAAGRELRPPSGLAALVDDARAVLIDGHHPALALAAARAARARGRLCVLDGGSWKDNTAIFFRTSTWPCAPPTSARPGRPGRPGCPGRRPAVSWITWPGAGSDGPRSPTAPGRSPGREAACARRPRCPACRWLTRSARETYSTARSPIR
jgi:hypothetical protein